MQFIQANFAVFLLPFVFLFVYFFGKHMFQHVYYYILGALIIVTVVMFVDIPFVSNMIDRGHLSLAFFIHVIFAGVFKKKSKMSKILSISRGENAILGFIFLFPHALNRLSLALYGYNTTGLIAFILFIPLVLTSFMIVRKKMKPIHWKRLHKLSYITYILIYIHIGFNIYFRDPFFFAVKPNVWLFHLLPILYIMLRVFNIIIPKYKQRATT
ncbi:MAG: hypothetical protein NUK62_07670 [Tenericutes bacterium]|nr:hypothetical protein [Mycoplasmatota bacterium]